MVERSDTALWTQVKHDLILALPLLAWDKLHQLFESQFRHLHNRMSS